MESISSAKAPGGRVVRPLLASAVFTVLSLFGLSAFAQGAATGAPTMHGGGEDSLVIPDQLDTLQFFGMPASHLLQLGLVRVGARHRLRARHLHAAEERARAQVDARGLRAHLRDLQDVPLHAGEVPRPARGSSSATVIVVYYGVLKGEPAGIVLLILFFSVVGIAGSGAVALFGIRVNTFANSRTAFASLRGKPYPVYAIPLKAGMSIGMMLISIELAFMLAILHARSRTSTRASASSASPSASRSAPRRCASPAASSRRSPTSARTS